MSKSNPPSKFSQEAATPSGPTRVRGSVPEFRATLDGLVVEPTHFDEWLDAGGERRRKPRQANAKGVKR